jgi:hypothetical protein
MDTREVPCSAPKCRKAASYKIAAPWSDGRYEELTTYELACVDHFATAYREAERRKLQFPPSSNEKVGEVGIYRCSPDLPSKQATRLLGLEATCRSWDQEQQRGSHPNHSS